jgi:hypothetical protein
MCKPTNLVAWRAHAKLIVKLRSAQILHVALHALKRLFMKHKKNTAPSRVTPAVTELNTILEEVKNLDWVALDRQINKDTGTWKRVQEISGIPLSPETKQKISYALKGHGVSPSTREKISTSLRKFHEQRNQDQMANGEIPRNSVDASTGLVARSNESPSASLDDLEPEGAPNQRARGRRR